MGTESRYPQRVPKSTTELNEDQKALLGALRGSVAKIRQDEAKYRRLLLECKEAGIPIAHLAEAVGVQRKTIYAHLLDQAER